MLIRRCAPLLAAAGAGFCVGCAFDERVKRSLAVFAHAANVAVLNPPSLPTTTSDKLVGTGESRSSQIMRYGFPGYDNLRTFEDFVLSYDRRHRTVHWVLEHVTPDRLEYAPSVDRSKCAFVEDTSIHEYFRARNGDYKGSGYDRGHMAAAGNHRRSQTAIEQTFTLSNMAPQVGKGFNRDKWNELEKHVRSRARKCRNMFVCTGPLYLPRPDARDGQMYVRYRVIGATQVAVPTHFFKALLIERQDGRFELETYCMPNEVIPDATPIANFLVPHDSVERAAGFLIYDKLDRKQVAMINGKRC